MCGLQNQHHRRFTMSETFTFPNSKKVYIQGSRPDIRVPMREITLSPTTGRNGEEVPNEPVRVYDTSGPYTDPNVETDIRKGLPALRRPWILERGDVEEYEGREVKPVDDGYRSKDPLENEDLKRLK